MTLNEFYLRVTNQELPVAMQSTVNLRDPPTFKEYQQTDVVGEDQVEAIRDSIHLDWTPIRSSCPECGVNVKIWETFAHRKLWNRTWINSVAFQPLSMRYETDRWDSPIEGFVFRLWTWYDPKDTFTLGKNKLKPSLANINKAEFYQNKNDKVNENNANINNVEDEDPDSDSFNNIYKSHNYGTDYQENMEEDEQNTQQMSNPYSIISNLIPFGNPNLGISRRRLLALNNNNVAPPNSHYNNILHTKRKKSHRKSSKKKVHNNHHRVHNYDNYRPISKDKYLNRENSHTTTNSWSSYSGQESTKTRIFREQTRYLNLTETIYYATLNHTNLKIVSLFNHSIVQQCTYHDVLGTYRCSPHYNTQSNSSKFGSLFYYNDLTF